MWSSVWISLIWLAVETSGILFFLTVWSYMKSGEPLEYPATISFSETVFHGIPSHALTSVSTPAFLPPPPRFLSLIFL
jgi:hypothetical protein